MNLVPLADKGLILHYVIVDDEDAAWAHSRVWRPQVRLRSDGTKRIYAVRHGSRDCRPQTFLMHREILERKVGRQLSTTEFTDHENGNGLHNWRDNLRISSKSQNGANVKHPAGVSGYRGVVPKKGRWQSKIRAANKIYYLGSFGTALEAALAYDVAALEHFGEFATINFPRAAGILNAPAAPDSAASSKDPGSDTVPFQGGHD